MWRVQEIWQQEFHERIRISHFLSWQSKFGIKHWFNFSSLHECTEWKCSSQVKYILDNHKLLRKKTLSKEVLQRTRLSSRQWRSEGISSVAFKVLIINCQINFINLQLFNFRYKFVYLQLFNVRYKFVYLQLFDVKFLFSKNHIFRKQKRMAAYGRASLVSDFKLTPENDDLLSPRHK